MSGHSQEARTLFLEGYNCAQAVMAAYSDETGLDRETALKLGASLGGGMGRLREVCGAVSGMLLVAGLLRGPADARDRTARADHYRLVRDLADRFTLAHGSIICRDLLGVNGPAESALPDIRSAAYYQGRPCANLVETAGALLDELIIQKSDSADLPGASGLQSRHVRQGG